MRALRRGVRVRTLFGNLIPTHAGIPFGGPWSSARMAATELVHSRQDLLVQHGTEACRLTVSEQPGWDPGLGSIRAGAAVLEIDPSGRRGVDLGQLKATYWPH